MSAYLIGVWGSSGSDVFAVGDGGTILHYNGSAWSTMNGGTAPSLSAAWGNSGSDGSAVRAHPPGVQRRTLER